MNRSGQSYAKAGTVKSMKSILAVTCEDKVAPRHPISPLLPGSGNPFRFFIQDPFGLRRAIVPVFLSNGEHLIGSGTAFHVDHFGTLVTADHVVSAIREGRDFGNFEPNTEKLFDLAPTNSRPYIWLGGVMVYGHAPLPEGMLVGVDLVRSPLRKLDDPMAALMGRSDAGIAADVAALKIEPVKRKDWLATLPIRVSGWRPKKGDTVIAVGFPEIKDEILDPSTARHLLSEGMYAGYGTVIAAHPTGRDSSNPSPVIEVEADWPAGMSGGPVFNESGEVVGLVSRSIAPEEGKKTGHAWFVCFQWIPDLVPLLPTIDVCNPAHRLGWAVLRPEPWHLLHFCETRDQATELIVALPEGHHYEIRFGSNRIGSDDFISGNAQ